MTEDFHQKQIHAFIDDKLEKGDEIWPSLVGAIQGSLISLTIFSENYSSSRWCLEELVKIIECRETYGQTVIPVLYHVNPTDVRPQKGSYEKALAEHEKKEVMNQEKRVKNNNYREKKLSLRTFILCYIQSFIERLKTSLYIHSKCCKESITKLLFVNTKSDLVTK